MKNKPFQSMYKLSCKVNTYGTVGSLKKQE